MNETQEIERLHPAHKAMLLVIAGLCAYLTGAIIEDPSLPEPAKLLTASLTGLTAGLSVILGLGLMERTNREHSSSK